LSPVLLYVAGMVGSFVGFHYLSEALVDSAVVIGRRLGLSEAVTGATLAAAGTSAPEFGSSLFSVLLGHPDVGLGTIVGSAVYNVTVIPGLAAVLAGPLLLNREVYIRDVLFYILALGLVLGALMDGVVERWEALLWVAAYVAYVLVMKRSGGSVLEDEEAPGWSVGKAVAVGSAAVIGIGVLSEVLVRSTVGLCDSLGVSEATVSVLVNAAGTSVPDTMASLHAAKRGLGSMAVSNAVGSNTFDLLVCLGVPLSLVPRLVVKERIYSSAAFLLGCVVALWLLSKDGDLKPWEGIVLLSAYAGFVAFTLLWGGGG